MAETISSVSADTIPAVSYYSAPKPETVVEAPIQVILKPTPVEVSFRFSEAKRFLQILDAVAVLTDEVTLHLTGEKLHVQTMDPSHVAMIVLDMPRTMFHEYDVAAPVDLCFNLSDLKKLFGNRVKADDEIMFKHKTQQINPSFEVTLRGFNVRKYRLLSLDASLDEMPSPKINYKAERRVVTKSLLELLKDAASDHDHVSLVFEKDRDFTVQSRSDSGDFEGTMGDEYVLNGQTNEPSKATFSINYLLDMVAALAKIEDVATVELTSDMPLRITLALPADASLVYYLAPRIES
jgi:proliferating cell nuclear antigen